tara:strand:+ start:14945 stop:15958 length:1014 start_codon:yes stop_codon:yes gene_type:complete
MKDLILSLICAVITSVSYSQDYHSSNMQYLTLLHNPALAALKNEVEASVSYRTQWQKNNAPFKTVGASVSSSLQPKRRPGKSYLAMGVNFYEEQVGRQSSNLSLMLSTTYHLKMSKLSTLSVGISIGYYRTQLSEEGTWEKQHNGQFFDPSLPSGELFINSQRGSFDSGTGLVYSLKSKKQQVNLFQFGTAFSHLNKIKNSSLTNGKSRLPIRSTVFSSFAIPIGKKGSYIEAKAIFQNQNKFNYLTIGAITKIKLLEKAKSTSSISKLNEIYAGIGLYIRNRDALIFNALIQKSNWTISLAYDVTTSNLKRANNSFGALEIQLRFTVPTFKMKSHF